MIKKIKAYLTWEKESLRSAKELIRERNRRMLVMLQSAMVVSYGGLLIFSVIQNGYSSFQALYAFMLLYMLLCLVFILKTPSMSVGHLTYGVYIVTILLCMYATSFVDPDYINSEAYIFFLLFPILYVDYSPRLDILNLVLASMYLYNILEFKNGKALALDAINIVCFSLLGMAIGHFTRYRAIRSFAALEKGRQSQLRDPLTGLPNHQCLQRDLSTMPVIPQAVIYIQIRELGSPLPAFGLRFQEELLLQLGRDLEAAAREQGIDLYCCGKGIMGLAQPRLLEGLFQRLEPLHHVLSSFEYHRNEDEILRLHFGIGAAPCDSGIESAFEQASTACLLAQRDGSNRIVL
ncbi:MAG: GGDEF domain-containing protein [Eubacteriales bacterium]|nr:GGDEF domain-containing protein [Eubacteriales bacterium]